MTLPVRIQRKRVKGWRMPPNTLYVGRPTKWRNPFVIGARHPRDRLHAPRMDAETCVDLFRRGLEAARLSWTGIVPGSLFHDDQADVYKAWEWAAPHLHAVELADTVAELRGKNLACWCALDQPCHADVLLELANKPSSSRKAVGQPE